MSAFLKDDFHKHKGCKDTITCLCVLTKDNMPGPALRQEQIHFSTYFHIHIIANRCLLILHANLIACLVKAQIGHDGCDNCVVLKASLLHEIFATHIHDTVTVYDISILVYRDTSVCVSIVSKSYVKLLLFHELLKHLNMSRTAISIDVRSFGSLLITYVFAPSASNTLFAIANALPFDSQVPLSCLQKSALPGRSSVPCNDFFCCIIDCTSDLFLCRQRELFYFAIDIRLDLFLNFRFHLIAGAVNYLDSVIIKRIVAC